MKRSYRIVIWGAGWEYSNVSNTIFKLVEKGQGEVLGIMADSLPPSGTLDGFPILPKSALRELDFDYLILCIKGNDNEVISQINSDYSVPRERIIRSGFMRLPHFDFAEYMRLRESNITIISNLCWGGYMYKLLDLRCMSPFRNLYLEDADYFRLLDDLEGHCKQHLDFSRIDYDASNVRHPVMLLGDVEIHFNHVGTPEEARFEWEKRVGRINWSNLFVMYYTINRSEELAFNALNSYEKRICFVPYETDAPHSIQLYQRNNGGRFFDLVNATAIEIPATYPFNPIKMLLGDSNYARYLPERGAHA